MTVKISWRQALAWRMRRHLLDPPSGSSVAEVVGRLCGVQSQVASSADLAVRVRQDKPEPGDVSRALDEGDIVKTWAMHGALHLLTPEDAGSFLSLIAAGKVWERPSWQRYFGMTAKHWEAFRDTVRESLDGAALTRDELVDVVVAQPGLAHIGAALRSGWGTLLKPLAWQGELCVGPSRGGRPTFMRPADASPRWAGVSDPAEAAPAAISAYFGAYGPASAKSFADWVGSGWVPTRPLRAAVKAMGDRMVELDVEGEPALVMADDLDELASTKPTTAVRLLPGFDQYVLGPGTADGHIVPVARRAAVSRQAGWISPIAVSGGVVSGTWELDADRVRVTWFSEAGRVPRGPLEAEVARLSSLLDRGLHVEINQV